MADKPFRVLLDLTDLHIESFKYVWINVAPRELKTISDLKKSVLQKLNLEIDDIKLFVRDGLLLEEETIIVLREEDTVKVQYEAQCSLSLTSEKKETAKCSRKRNHSASNISDLPVNTKRHKAEEHVINNSGEFDMEKSKSKKNKKSHSVTVNSKNSSNTENNCSLIVENKHIEDKTHKKKKKKSSILDYCAEGMSFDKTEDPFFSFEISQPAPSLKSPPQKCTAEEDKTIDLTNDLLSEKSHLNFQNKTINLDNVSQNKKSDESTNNCPKKKRKRRRKRKQPTVVTVFDNDDANCNITLQSKCEDENREVMHSLHYSSLNKSQESSLINESSLLHNISTNTYTKEKCLETKLQSSNNYPKVSTPAQSNSCDDPFWVVSLTNSANSVNSSGASSKKELHREVHKKPVVKSFNQTKSMPLKKSMNYFPNSSLTNEDQSPFKRASSSNMHEPAIVVKPVSKDEENSQNSDSNKIRQGKHYSDFPDLSSLPKVGTHIAYRTLELDENYSPTITDYREGIVKNINPDTEEIEIELIQELIKPGRTGKFENLREDETPPPEIKTCDVVKWSSIISPKCLS